MQTKAINNRSVRNKDFIYRLIQMTKVITESKNVITPKNNCIPLIIVRLFIKEFKVSIKAEPVKNTNGTGKKYSK
ncbi:MAG: hypothetical protein P8X74_18165 [Reinekea sp.]